MRLVSIILILFTLLCGKTVLAQEKAAYSPVDSLTLAGKKNLKGDQAQEKPPVFPGGEEAMFRFMGTNFRIPPDDIRRKVSGTTQISFVVGVDGAVSNPKVVKSLTGSIDREAIRVIKRMPKWQPALLNGVPVPYTMTIPYTIRTR